MDQLTMHCDASGPRTTLHIDGALEARHCRLLRETLDMATTLRPGNPVVVDLRRVTYFGIAAQACLAAAIRQSTRLRQSLTLRNVPAQVGPALRPPAARRRAVLVRV